MQMRVHTVAASPLARKAMSWMLAASIGAAGIAAAMAPVQAQGLAGGLAPLGDHAAGPITVQAPPPGWWGPGPGRGRGPGPGPGPGWRRPPPPGPHPGWGNPYWRNNGWYYRDNSGAWIAAGIVGAALGAAAISAAQQNNQMSAQQQREAVAYCMQRYRSYDPRTGTFIGYDGQVYSCP